MGLVRAHLLTWITGFLACTGHAAIVDQIAPRELSCAATPHSTKIVKTSLGSTPAIVRIPKRVIEPPIVLWHGFGPPASELALMDALPLDEVPAIKVYLGLPLFGDRSAAPGESSLGDRQTQDYGLLLFEPAVLGAARELPAVVAALRQAGCMRSNEPVSLFGFSASGAAVLYALSEHDVRVSSAVIVNGITGLQDGIQAFEHAIQRRYTWSNASTVLAEQTDFARRPGAIARDIPYPALLFIHGTGDEVVTSTNAKALYEALAPLYSRAHEPERLELRLTDIHHGWTAGASNASIRRHAASWFSRFGRRFAADE